jgi:hypothetical protein
MSRLSLCCLAALFLTIICLTSTASTGAEAELRRVEVPQSPVCNEVTCDIGDLIAARRVEPREAIVTEAGRRGTWLLRDPQSPTALRWPRNLLNAGPEAPELVIDPQLQGTYDVVAIVRAVDGGRAGGAKAAAADPLPMAFELALDDGSQREIVGAKDFEIGTSTPRCWSAVAGAWTAANWSCGAWESRSICTGSASSPVHRPSGPRPARRSGGWRPIM